MVDSPRDSVARGREALQAGDAVGARSVFEGALTAGTSGPALEGLSAASYVLLEFPRSIDEMERAHAAYRSEGDGPGCGPDRTHLGLSARNHDRGLGDRRAAGSPGRRPSWSTSPTPRSVAGLR
jgi:hypothetical protein